MSGWRYFTIGVLFFLVSAGDGGALTGNNVRALLLVVICTYPTIWLCFVPTRSANKVSIVSGK